jgi:hypothetical protein
MQRLTDREQRAIRRAAVAIAIYLVAFYGWRGWKVLEDKRFEYQLLWRDAQHLKQIVQPYEDKALHAQKLMEAFRFDPAKLARKSVVSDASAAIQKAATGGGIQLGPIRESPARSAARELASMQLEGSGPIAAALAFLQQLESIGFPLILESVQLSPDATKPGMVKLNLTIVILDFDQWKNEEPRHA